jgi:hypothetical protein
MFRGVTVVLVAVVLGVAAPSAFADPINAKGALVVTADCSGTQVSVVVNGQGVFAPGHVVGSTAVFIPTVLDVTIAFTPTGGATEVELETGVKAHQPSDAITCQIPASLNTFTFPFGTLVVSGTVSGFLTPASS